MRQVLRCRRMTQTGFNTLPTAGRTKERPQAAASVRPRSTGVSLGGIEHTSDSSVGR